VYDHTTSATYISSTEIHCDVPIKIVNKTCPAQVELYYNGILVKKFSEPLLYMNYHHINKIYPARGTRAGGTQLLIEVLDL